MKREADGVTLVIHRDGRVESSSIRIPIWMLRVGAVAAATIIGLAVIAAATYAPVFRAASRVPFLTREISRLSAENQQVQQLARRLTAMEARYAQIRGMMGGVLPAPSRSPETLVVARPIAAAVPGGTPTDAGPSTPSRWPLDDSGVITRGQVGVGAGDEAHPGVDVAVPMGTPIRAAGGGVVAESGRDPDYGLFVLIEHPEGFQTMYGHASRVLVSRGDQVSTGEVIALSVSTGRSTAPHLHFEIRKGSRSIDPRSLLKGATE